MGDDTLQPDDHVERAGTPSLKWSPRKTHHPFPNFFSGVLFLSCLLTMIKDVNVPECTNQAHKVTYLLDGSV